jgi:pyruvate/2-oxoglutarate dehydrogenase complex dihydrolipoamide acyltransferase (E2) component
MRYKDNVCLFGAIRAVCLSSEVNVEYEIVDRIRKVIKHTQVTNWNDAPERTKQEVIDMLKKAAQCG